MSLSTHILDTARGEPAPNVPVTVQKEHNGQWAPLASGATDAEGRIGFSVFSEAYFPAGRYRLVFDTASYYGPDGFFPEVSVVFVVSGPPRHYHVPLLLSPYGYTTYRGS